MALPEILQSTPQGLQKKMAIKTTARRKIPRKKYADQF